MKQVLFCVLLSVALVAGSTAMSAQEIQKEGRIHQRKENQQRRIANGVASGQLTAHETARIERKETNLNKEIRSDRKANGGTLTPQQKRQVNRQQNRLSKGIYKQKHDRQRQPR